MELGDEDHGLGWGIRLLKSIWAKVLALRIEDLFGLITRPSVALSDAIKSENDHEVINTFLDMVLYVKDPNGRNLLHLLFLHRRYQIFNEIFITFLSNRIEQLVGAVDNEGNNVLHLAAFFTIQFQSFSGLSAYIQMQRELAWFKVNSFISLFLFNHSLLLFYSKTSVPQLFTYFLVINRKLRKAFLVN